jgi:bifunctional DNA-binding transcriptional regulator/antitoxin component of YhaV-PrlF toxin-antitoxin module
MEHAIIRKNHQLSLPPGLLKRLNLQPGQTFICIVKGDVISLVPKHNIQSVRGLLKGANTENYRDRNERI